MSATAAHIRTSRWPGTLAAPRSLRWRALLRGAWPAVVLAAATVAFCWKLLLAGLVVIGYDTMTYMYPYRFFAAAALRDGHLPLWNPYIYFGAPFLANLQSAVFYPPHVLFLFLRTTQAMNWSVALHLFLAAYMAYLAGRHVVGLDPASATVAGALYGLSGFVGAQVGHLNQLNAAAWLPAALCTLHLALTRQDRKWVAATAAILAVQLLAGHAQESYMTLALLATYAAFHVAWTVWRVYASPQSAVRGRSTSRLRTADCGLRTILTAVVWAGGTLAVAGGLAGAIAAAQLLPTEELTRYSIRSAGMPIWEASAFSLPPRELFVGLLPTFGLAAPSSNEYLGWVGVGGLTLALLGLLFRVHRPGTLFFALMAMLSFLLALGNHFPLYDRIYHLPGMNLFRVPARWMLLTSLSLAMLGGSGLAFLRRLGHSGWPAMPAANGAAGPWRRLAAATRLLLGVVVAVCAAAALWPIQKVGATGATGTLPAIWLATSAAAVALAFWALAAAPSVWPGALFTAWVFIELFAASRSLEYNNPNPESVYTDSRPVIDALEADPDSERILSIAATGYQPADADHLVAGYQQLLGPNGVLATWINTKYKETLNPNLPMVYALPSVDGYDGGVLPLRRYVEFKTLFVPPEQNQPDALLRDQLRQPPGRSVLRLLGVKYLIDDAIGDVTQDGVYYDLAGAVTLGPGERVRLSQIATQAASRASSAASAGGAGPIAAIGVVTSLDGTAALPDGTPAAQLVLGGDAGPLWQAPLVIGRDTAEGAYTAAASHQQPAPLPVPGTSSAPGAAGAGGSAPAMYLARVPVEGAAAVRWVEIQSALNGAGQRVRLYGLTLVGQNGDSWPLAVAGDDTLQLVHRSDVKLYRNEQPVPRAYVVNQAQVVESPAAALDAMRRPDYDPQRLVVLERDPGPPPLRRPAWRNRLRAWRDGLEQWLGVGSDPREGTVPREQTLPETGPDATGDAMIVEDAAERIALRVEAAQPAVLVVRDTYFPGWSAAVDGRPAPLWRADYLFRAVPVPAGSHTVELSFHSRALTRGLQVSLLALLMTAALAFLPLPARAVRPLRSAPNVGQEW